MNRRDFMVSSGVVAAALSLTGPETFAASKRNKLPQWRGFNLLDFFSPNPESSRRPTTEDHFRWMQDWGFNFVRIPMAYPHYLNIDRSKNIVAEDAYKINNEAVDRIDKLVMLAHKYDMHVSLNLHRAQAIV